MKARYVVFGLLLLLAGWLAWFGDKTPDSPVVEPQTRADAAPDARARAPRAVPVDEPGIGAVVPRQTLIAAHSTPSASLFGAHDWTPPPPKPAPAAPQKPTAPPLPFAYLGKKFENGTWEIYLGRGDDVFVVRENTTIENTYRVNSITASTLTLTYLPLKQTQQLALGGEE